MRDMLTTNTTETARVSSIDALTMQIGTIREFGCKNRHTIGTIRLIGCGVTRRLWIVIENKSDQPDKFELWTASIGKAPHSFEFDKSADSMSDLMNRIY